MYTHKIILSLLFVGIIATAKAQTQLDPLEYGVRIGLNTGSLFNVDTEEIYGIKGGLAIGGLVKFRLSRWLAIQPELLYSQQGAFDEGTSPTAEVKNRYLAIPLLVKLYPARRFNFQIGPQLGILLSSTYNDFDSRDAFMPSEIALVFGLEYEFNKGLLLGMRFSSGLTNINDVDTFSPLSGQPERVTNGYFLFSTGWRF